MRGCTSPGFPTEDHVGSSCAGEAPVLPIWNCGFGALAPSQQSPPSLRRLCKSKHGRRKRTLSICCALSPPERAARKSSRSEKKSRGCKTHCPRPALRNWNTDVCTWFCLSLLTGLCCGGCCRPGGLEARPQATVGSSGRGRKGLLGEPQFKEDVPSWSFSIPFLATGNNVISVELSWKRIYVFRA